MNNRQVLIATPATNRPAIEQIICTIGYNWQYCKKIPTIQLMPITSSDMMSVAFRPIRSGSSKYRKVPGIPHTKDKMKLICGSPDNVVAAYNVP